MQTLITANCDIRTKIDFEVCKGERSIEVKSLPEGGLQAKLQLLNFKNMTGFNPTRALIVGTNYNITVFDKDTGEVFFDQSMSLHKAEVEDDSDKDTISRTYYCPMVTLTI